MSPFINVAGPHPHDLPSGDRRLRAAVGRCDCEPSLGEGNAVLLGIQREKLPSDMGARHPHDLPSGDRRLRAAVGRCYCEPSLGEGNALLLGIQREKLPRDMGARPRVSIGSVADKRNVAHGLH
jgi:hypothetical protein